MIPTFQAACKSRATRLGVPPSPDELAAFDQSENLTSMHFKQLYSVLGLPLVQNKKKNSAIRQVARQSGLQVQHCAQKPKVFW